MYLNRVTLIGFTGQEANAFATQSGKEITRFSVATTRRYQQDSEWKEKMQWHDCVLHGGPAQYAGNLPKVRKEHTSSSKGSLTHRGYNRTIETESASVNVQWPVVEIVVKSIKVLDRKKREDHEMEGAA